MFTSLVSSASAARRIERAASWLAEQPRDAPLLIVGGTLEAANALVRQVVTNRVGGAVFGWHRTTFGRLANTMAETPLAAQSLARSGALTREAVVARVVHELGEQDQLGQYQAVRHRPGLPRALANTLEELRLGGVDLTAVLFSNDLWRIYQAYLAALDEYRLADRARVLHLAASAAGTSALAGMPVLLLDVAVRNHAEQQVIQALAQAAPATVATVAAGDIRSQNHLEAALGVRASRVAPRGNGPLSRMQKGLFGREKGSGDGLALSREALAPEVRFLSAPGESRECVEIAREVLREAEKGVPFDRMAVVLRSPGTYSAHLVEAFRRAGVPLYLADGTRLPNPAGRALLALLACAADGLSASRFAEYASLGQIPDLDDAGAPAAPPDSGQRWVPPDAEVLTQSAASAVEGAGGLPTPGYDGFLRSPRRWEQLLVDASVIGGLDRWERRLNGLSAQLDRRLLALDDPDAPAALGIQKSRADLSTLRAFAMPVLTALEGLPKQALWGVWLEALSHVSAVAIRHSDRVQQVLTDLAPMADVGPVTLDEVRIVLTRRLSELTLLPEVAPAGAVYASRVDGIRGMAMDVVFVPGLAERIFPQKIQEDPVLLDAARRHIGAGLDTFEQRVSDERLCLRLAVGAARQRLVLSWPRLEVDKGRPRVPSFYGLELLRAACGVLPGFEDLQRLAERGGAPSVGWPAPQNPIDAIDASEHDLAWLRTLFGRPDNEVRGAARYLVGANAHLARALRAQWCRFFDRHWTPYDGLVKPGEESRVALDTHTLTARSYSATALQNFAGCPYRFLLYAVHRLGKREEPEAIEQLDALSRGSLIHDVQFELLTELRTAGLLPVTEARLEVAREHLDTVLTRVEAQYRDDLAPAIERVWVDEMALIRADIGEWLYRQTQDTEWTPKQFELSFGLKNRGLSDEASQTESVPLGCGISLRGSIDLVEQASDGRLRATDYKTGRASMKRGAVIAGGKTLQPVLYSLALEAMSKGATVESGRLYYCTGRGGFEARDVPLDERARASADRVAKAVRWALDDGMFPQAPEQNDGCKWCDYKDVCGAGQEKRTRTKPRMEIQPLERLREME